MDPTLPQALHAINGDTLNKKLMDEDGRIAALARGTSAGGDIVDEIYLSALSRRPSAAERQRAGRAASTPRPTGAQIVEDLAWAVLTSREFLFTH